MIKFPADDATDSDGAVQDFGPRLLRLAYVILSPSLGRRRRARIAEATLRKSLDEQGRRGTGGRIPTARLNPAELAEVRLRLVQRVLFLGRGWRTIPGPAGGWRPATGAKGAGTRDAERQLAALVPAARAAYALRLLERLSIDQTCALLRTVGVRDPETVTALADKATLDEQQIRALEIPLGRPVRRRLVLAGVAVAVIGVGAPVIAAQASGSGASQTTPRVAPAAHTTQVDAPAPPTQRKTSADTPSAAEQQDEARRQARVEKVQRDLARILRQLTTALKESGTDGPEADRLRQLMNTVKKQQERAGAGAVR